ncbi:MAG: hypothetical protein H0U44_10235 [Flavisolibacter sp.]|jgi:hypothetical protein|nr:hypothetical protein [Flavisolibacter sp.]
MKALYALEGGVAGAAALTLIHESIKRAIPGAPRMDLLGMNALSKGLKVLGAKTPDERKLYGLSLTGDIISNSLFYSFAGIGNKENALARGAGLGLLAGLGAVLLPKPFGLPEGPSARTTETKLLTIGLYVAGGLVAAAVMKWLDRKKHKQNKDWEQKLVTSSMA